MKHDHSNKSSLSFRNPQSAIRICQALLFAVCCFPLNPPAAPAAEGDPYRLLVCLHFSDDPLFTGLYTKSVQRQVQDQLANYFGALAKVEVVSSHPLIERIGSADVRSLQPQPTELAALQVPDKAFVFSLENVEGMYHLHWRQLDGLTQQVSAPQTLTTPDRQWVTKAVCLAVREDFAPVVIVQPDDRVQDLGQVKLEFPSAAHRALVNRWLTLNTILQPFYVLKQKDGSLLRSPMPSTVLRIGRNDVGQSRATFHSNAANPWKPTPRLVRYEALKLSVQKGHLRIRLLNAADGSPMSQCIARANTTGFASLNDGHQFTLPDRRGTVVSLLPIENLAFVEIVQSGRPWLKVPVPITGPMCDLTLKVSLDESAKEKSDWDRRLRYLVQDVSILQTSINKHVRVTNEMYKEKKYEEELRLMRSVLADVTKDRKSAVQTKDGLGREARDLKLPPPAMLAWVAERLAEIAATEALLARSADDLNKMINKMDAQARAQVLINAGDAAAQTGDYANALDKYELALNEQPDQPKLAEDLKRLKRAWELKGPAHERARKFIFQQWPQAGVTSLSAQFNEAEAAFATLQGVGDYLTATRLSSVNKEHMGSVEAETGLLVDSDQDDKLAELEKYQKIQEKFADFQQRIGEFIAAATAGGAAPVAAPASAPAAAAPAKALPVEEEEVPPKKP